MNFRRRRLASVLGLEICDSFFDLTAPLRIFFAQLVRDPVDLKTFELAPLIEFIARTITEFFHVTPQGRLIDFPAVAYRLDHVVGLEGVALSFRRYRKVCRRKVRVNMGIEGTACIMLKARLTEDSGCSPPFATLLVAALDAGQRFERLVSLGHSGAMRFKKAAVTAQNRHDRDRLLCRTLEVVTDDVRVALLEFFSARGLPREDGQERLVLGLK